MVKIKDFCKNFICGFPLMEDKKKHKLIKIVSFLVGACFDIFGILGVVLWKFLFCNKEENSKYCIRLSILGMIVKYIVIAKLFFWNSFVFISDIPFKEKFSVLQRSKQSDNNKHKQRDIFNQELQEDNDFFLNFSNIDREIKKMQMEFERQKEMVNSFIENGKDLANLATENFDEKKVNNFNVKKDVKRKGDYEITTIEKSSPNLSQKSVYIEYVGDKKENKKGDKRNWDKKVSEKSKKNLDTFDINQDLMNIEKEKKFLKDKKKKENDKKLYNKKNSGKKNHKNSEEDEYRLE